MSKSSKNANSEENKAKYLQISTRNIVRLRNGIDIYNALRKTSSQGLPSVKKDDGYLIKSRFTEGKLWIAKRWNSVRHFESQLAKSLQARSVYLCVVRGEFWLGRMDLSTRTISFFCGLLNFASFFWAIKIPVIHLRYTSKEPKTTAENGLYKDGLNSFLKFKTLVSHPSIKMFACVHLHQTWLEVLSMFLVGGEIMVNFLSVLTRPFESRIKLFCIR